MTLGVELMKNHSLKSLFQKSFSNATI